MTRGRSCAEVLRPDPAPAVHPSAVACSGRPCAGRRASRLTSDGRQSAGRYSAWVLVIALLALPALAQTPPALVLDAPPALAAAAARVRGFDLDDLRPAMRLTGAADAGPAIQITLVEESHPLAQRVPPWVAGFADSRRGAVIIFPSRIPNYPYDSMEEVIEHEVAHLLIDRAAKGGEIPRWFHEGVAITSSRGLGALERTRFAWKPFEGGPSTLAEVDAGFVGDTAAVRISYGLASSAVAELLDEAGPQAVARILARVGAGASFETAFAAVAGRSLPDFEREYFRDRSFWQRWVPILGSASIAWILILAVAAAAYVRRRRRAAALAEQWEAEEQRERIEASNPESEPRLAPPPTARRWYYVRGELRSLESRPAPKPDGEEPVN